MILVSGESLIDMLPGQQDGRRVYLPSPGGSPFNVAVALGRLRIPVRYLCPVSMDAFGEVLADKLSKSGVDTSWCRRTNEPSTLGFVSYTEGNRQPRYHFYTRDTAGCGLVRTDVRYPLPAEIKCIHAGSFSLAVETFGSTLEWLLTERAQGRFVSIDPNIRPFVINDRTAYLTRLQRLLSIAQLVKLSDEDLHWLYPGEKAGTVAERLLGGSTRLVVVTSGASGAIAFSKRAEVRVSAPAVPVMDTVGAGDTFQAGLLAWLHENTDMTMVSLERLDKVAIADMLDFAALAAAINCTRAGCAPPDISEMSRSIHQHTLVSSDPFHSNTNNKKEHS